MIETMSSVLIVLADCAADDYRSDCKFYDAEKWSLQHVDAFPSNINQRWVNSSEMKLKITADGDDRMSEEVKELKLEKSNLKFFHIVFQVPVCTRHSQFHHLKVFYIIFFQFLKTCSSYEFPEIS